MCGISTRKKKKENLDRVPGKRKKNPDEEKYKYKPHIYPKFLPKVFTKTKNREEKVY